MTEQIALTLRFRNDQETPLTVYIEPWGRQHILQQGETSCVTFFEEGAKPIVDVVMRNDGIEVWAQTGSYLEEYIEHHASTVSGASA